MYVFLIKVLNGTNWRQYHLRVGYNLPLSYESKKRIALLDCELVPSLLFKKKRSNLRNVFLSVPDFLLPQ